MKVSRTRRETASETQYPERAAASTACTKPSSAMAVAMPLARHM
jgi:hypothetical protein